MPVPAESESADDLPPPDHHRWPATAGSPPPARPRRPAAVGAGAAGPQLLTVSCSSPPACPGLAGLP